MGKSGIGLGQGWGGLRLVWFGRGWVGWVGLDFG